MSKRLILKKLQFRATNEGGCPNNILSRKGTIISNETDEERTCLLGGGAGRSPIDRVIKRLFRQRVYIVVSLCILRHERVVQNVLISFVYRFLIRVLM